MSWNAELRHELRVESREDRGELTTSQRRSERGAGRVAESSTGNRSEEIDEGSNDRRSSTATIFKREWV
jgi:hypothetical protein